MTRIVVSLSPSADSSGESPTVSLMLVSGATTGSVDPEATSSSPLPTFDGGEDIAARGRAMMSFLQSNPSVRDALSIALADENAAADPVPVYLRTSGAIDELPWEQIYAEDYKQYVALDGRWPIGRMARSSDGTALSPRFFTPPLSVVAVIAAALETPDGETYAGVRQLELIAAAVGTLDFARLHVISGHDDVIAEARKRQDDGARISVEGIGETDQRVAEQIIRAEPHVLHIFSHGSQVNNTRMLNLADRNDAAANQDTGKINLSTALLARALKVCQPWLVVLAACESAEPLGPQDPALARALVTSGVPAVIGMRRQVDVVVMHRVVGALYDAICQRMAQLVSAGSPRQFDTLDWAPALTGARTANTNPSPEQNDTWSDPVLYANLSFLQVSVTEPDVDTDTLEHKRGELDEWLRLRDQFPPGTPADVIADTKRKISELKQEAVRA